MKPGSGSQKLLYVTENSNDVNVYTYPALSYVGQLTGFDQPLFDCADKKGNVWIIDYGYGEAFKYAHGGTMPIAELTGLFSPYACAVDKNTGDLAIAENPNPGPSGYGEVAIYHKAKGSPTFYVDRNFTLASGLAYDGSGNLWVDGFAAGDAFHYAELPAGSATFNEVSLNVTPDWPGSVVWDGHYIDVADITDTVYQTQGSTVVNTITLNLTADQLRGYFVTPSKKQQLIAADSYGNDVAVFSYPAGGSSTQSITSGLNTPWDVVLSK